MYVSIYLRTHGETECIVVVLPRMPLFISVESSVHNVNRLRGHPQGWADHATSQKNAGKPVLLEEFGVTGNQTIMYTAWLNKTLSPGLTGDLIWYIAALLLEGVITESFIKYQASWITPFIVSPAKMPPVTDQ